MPQNPLIPTFIVKTHTAAADTIFKLTTVPLWFEDVNIHVYTNNAAYGDATDLANVYGLIYANDVISFRNLNLNDVYFRNATGGSNTTITAVGVLMSDARKKELGIRS